MTREALIRSKNCITCFLEHAGGYTNPSEDEQDGAEAVLVYIDSALTSLTEPFDPAKHLSGWVKRKPLNHLTTTQVYTFNGWHLVYDMLGGKLPYTLRKHDFLIRLAIPTASFFHALCGALNIK